MQIFSWQYIVLFSVVSFLVCFFIEWAIYGSEISAISSNPKINAETKAAKAIIRRYKIIYLLVVPLCSVVVGNIIANYVWFSTEVTRSLEERQLMVIGAYCIALFVVLIPFRIKQVTQDYVIPLGRIFWRKVA